jgi:hypothetical protein
MYRWMFNCKEVTRLVSESLDRELPFPQRMGVRMHLLMCKFCSRYRKQLLILKRATHFYALHGDDIESSTTLPTEARERIKSSLGHK